MFIKSNLYQTEKNEINHKVIDILYLKERNNYSIYDTNDFIDIQMKIVHLIPDIRKYFVHDSNEDWLIELKNIAKSKNHVEIYKFRSNQYYSVYLYIDNINKKILFSFS